MLPTQLTAASFALYPEQARALAVRHLSLLQALPLPLVPILLRELIVFDWKLPAERQELSRQFSFLASLPDLQRAEVLQGFRTLSPPVEQGDSDWVNAPSAFMEQLTAWLWSSGKMERFRSSADAYAAAVDQAEPALLPAIPRLGMVLIGDGVGKTSHPLFRKLRPHGTYLSHVNPDAEAGLAYLAAHASQRALATPGHPSCDFLHWVIVGGSSLLVPGLAQVSYTSLGAARSLLLTRIEQLIASGTTGPEQLRSLLARMKPTDLGLSGHDPILEHFQMSLLTEGAGTQIFATTFVQWAARECIRRAQPETLLVRYAPRQQAQTMNLMLAGAKPEGLDPEGSLIDADLGAYYAWLSMRRLTGSDQLRFLVWFEGHGDALVIGPGLPRGATSDSKMNMDQVLALFS